MENGRALSQAEIDGRLLEFRRGQPAPNAAKGPSIHTSHAVEKGARDGVPSSNSPAESLEAVATRLASRLGKVDAAIERLRRLEVEMAQATASIRQLQRDIQRPASH